MYKLTVSIYKSEESFKMEYLSLLWWAFILYAISYTLSKIVISIYSIYQIRLHKKRYGNDTIVITTNTTTPLPKVSIIAPAYNEGVLILDTVDTYLNQDYPNFEVIVCSDGGTDGTLEQLIGFYNLYEVSISKFKLSTNIQHKPIKRIFKSMEFNNLIVIDKVNGGKSDAQNAGISISSGEIVTIIDSDSILVKSALSELTTVFINENNVIGLGSPIGILNDTNIEEINNKTITVPKSIWAKIQILEYARSFLLGRMGIQKIHGIALISGAFGLYRKSILEAVGGYSSGSLAEDMDIDCKVWRYIKDNKLDYIIRYVPSVFCWSEVPNDLKNIKSQRDRWSRGFTETIWKNRDLFMNYKKGLFGMFTFPYYVFFEWLTPIIEIIGLIVFIILYSIGRVEPFFLHYTFLIYYIIGVLTNILVLYAEHITNGYYKSKNSLFKLGVVSLIEPLFYHWINSMIYVYGNIRLATGARGWGTLERRGLKKIN